MLNEVLHLIPLVLLCRDDALLIAAIAMLTTKAQEGFFVSAASQGHVKLMRKQTRFSMAGNSF